MVANPKCYTLFLLFWTKNLNRKKSITFWICDHELPFLVGTKLFRLGIFSGLALDSPHEDVGLKDTWLNFCIVFPCCLEFGGFFHDPNHVLDFICCLEFYPHVFFILLLLEQQSPCQWFPEFNGDYGIYAICELVRSFVGCCLG